MFSNKEITKIDLKYERNRMVTFLIMFSIIVLFLVVMGLILFNFSWSSSSYFHSALEITGSFIALFCGLACLMYFFERRNRFYLIIGLAFFVSGSEDLVHGMFSIKNFLSNNIDFSRYIPATYVSGRLILGTMFIIAPQFESIVKSKKAVIKESIVFTLCAIIFGAVLTIVASKLSLPRFIYQDRFISRPADFISLIVFLISLIVVVKHFMLKRKTFSGFLVATVLFNIGAQLYMSFSKNLYDGFFDAAHFLKIFSYLIIVQGMNVQMLREFRRKKSERKKRKKTEENLEYHRNFENILINISTKFVNLSSEKIDEAIDHALESIGRFSDVDHAGLFIIDEDNRETSVMYEWAKEGTDKRLQAGVFDKMSLDMFPWVTNALLKDNPIQVNNLDYLPLEAKRVKNLLTGINTKSFLIVPIFFEDNLIGFLAVDSIRGSRVWDEDFVNLLQITGRLFANVLKRREYEDALKITKKEAEDASIAKDIFIANMGHELRTPMNAILGISDVLYKKNQGRFEARQLEGLKLINDNGHRLLSLIDTLLDVSKIEANKMEKSKTVFSLNKLMNNIDKMVRNLLRNKDIDFYIDRDFKEVDHIILDKEKLNQILINLLGNAVKFTQKGKITLKMRIKDKNKLYFEIKDTGIGINKKDLPYVFDRYKQIDNSLKDKNKGTGLGLALTKELITFLDGDISIKSKLNQGTVVSFYLPFKINQRKKEKYVTLEKVYDR